MDKAQFEALAGRYRDMVYRIALNRLRNPADAEDIVQDVLLKLYLHRGGFADETNAKHWLIRVTLNQCNSLWRNPWKKAVPIDELCRDIPFTDSKDSDLFMAVMALSAQHRTILYLFYYEDLNVKEIADLMGLSVSAVTSRLHRARKRLKYDLAEGANHV